jgi:hypothetical protein
MPAIAGGATGSPSTADLLGMLGGGQAQAGGGSPDQARGAVEQVMAQLRQIGQQVESLGQMPALAPEVQQLRQLLKRMIEKAGQGAPPATASAGALPMGG